MIMKPRYRLFLRGETYYCEDTVTRKQTSLHAKDKTVALRLLHTKNEAEQLPAINLQIARAYLAASDPQIATRTWQFVMDEAAKLKKGTNLIRWSTAMRAKALDGIRHMRILETRPEHFLRVLETGTVSCNQYLRRVQNFALDMSWLAWPVLPKKRWPVIHFKERRGITWDEHQKILAGERNLELRAYYQLLWHLGGSQTDMASLMAEDIDWTNQTLSYARLKTGTQARIHFGDTIAELLRSRPTSGHLFPQIVRWKESDRAKIFMRRCRLVGVSGVSLHCYRYAWAERAMEAGYPERFAMQALGHTSKAVHRAYSKKAQVLLPPLEDYEKKMRAVIVPMSIAAASGA
jgi:integrase